MFCFQCQETTPAAGKFHAALEEDLLLSRTRVNGNQLPKRFQFNFDFRHYSHFNRHSLATSN